MIRIKTVMKNIGPHKDLEIEYSDGITPIVGKNGAGKTFVLESLPACLFGVFPSRGSINGCITQGHIGDSYLAEEFSLEDNHYLVERKIKTTAKTISQEAMIYCNGKPVAGPKIKDVEDIITTIIGDKSLFFASVFSSQFGAYDIIDETPSKRKELLNKMLGLDSLKAEYERLKDISASIMNEQSSLSFQLENKQGLLDTTVCKELIVDLNEKVEIENGLKKRIEKIIETQSETLKTMISNKDRKEEDAKAYNTKKIELDNQLKSLYLALQKRCDLEDKIKLKDSIIKHQENRLEVIKYNEKVSIENKKATDEMLANQSVKEQIYFASEGISKLNNNIASGKEIVSVLQRETKILDGIDTSNEQCKDCHLLSNAFRKQAQIPDTIKYIEENEKEVVKLEDKKAALEKLITNKYQLMPLKDIPADRSVGLMNIAEFEKQIAVLSGSLENISKEIDESKVEVEKLKETVDFDSDKGINEYQEKRRKESLLLDDKVSLIKSLEADIVLKTDILNRNAIAEKEIAELKEKEKEILKREKINDYLMKAFGKNGIPALIIDQAIPKIQMISDELLQIASNGKFSLTFDTIKENKDGTLRESLEILCACEDGVRDVSTFSGGEQKILKAVLRLSLAIFQSQNSGVKFKTLMIDELFDALDSENSYNILSVLNKTKEYFERIIFVSHDDEIVGSYQNKIVL